MSKAVKTTAGIAALVGAGWLAFNAYNKHQEEKRVSEQREKESLFRTFLNGDLTQLQRALTIIKNETVIAGKNTNVDLLNIVCQYGDRAALKTVLDSGVCSLYARDTGKGLNVLHMCGLGHNTDTLELVFELLDAKTDLPTLLSERTSSQGFNPFLLAIAR